jgi:hypothetical protein
MKKNYLILNYDYDTAEVVFPKFCSDADSYVEFETFQQNLAHNLCEIDYDTKSYTKTCFDFSLEHKPENLKDAKQRLVEHCDHLVKFFRLKKSKAVVKKQWEIESCVSMFKHEKEILKIRKSAIEANLNDKFPSKFFSDLDSYTSHLKVLVDDIKSSHKKIDEYRSLYKELQKVSA